MSTDEAPTLFKLTAGDCERELSRMFALHAPAYPIRIAMAAAALLAEAACQRISSAAFRRMDESRVIDWLEYYALPPRHVRAGRGSDCVSVR
jgi:hypothetical protein